MNVINEFPEYDNYILTEDEAIIVAKRYKKESSVDFYCDCSSGHTFIESCEVGDDINVPTVYIKQIAHCMDDDEFYEAKYVSVDFRDIPKVIKELKRVYDATPESAINEDNDYYNNKSDLGLCIMNFDDDNKG